MIILTDNSNRKTILMIKAEVVEIVAGVNVAKICLGFFFCPTITKSSPSCVLGNESEARCQGSRRTTIWSLNGTQSCKLNLNSWYYGSYRFNWRLQNRQPASWVLTLD